jgi:hypothetical protein
MTNKTPLPIFYDQKTAEIDGLIADKEKFIELITGKTASYYN